MQKSNFREDIQGLRAIAVMVVVLFHAQIERFSGGYIGVDVFFVISGYVITSSIRRRLDAGNFSFADFYTRRARRLFPALFATLTLTTVGALSLFSPEALIEYASSLAASAASVSNILFWHQAGYFDSDVIAKPLLHTWSLSVEEQFYLIWPIVLVGIIYLRKPVAGICLVAVVSFACLMIWPAGSATFYLTPFRVYQFAVGALLVWSPICRENVLSELLAIIGFSLLAFGALSFNASTAQSTSGAIATLSASCIILGGRARWSGIALRSKPLVRLGNISYSVYLMHWPLIVLYSYAIQRPFTQFEKGTMVGLSVLFGVALFYAVEQRYSIAKVREFGPRRFWAGYASITVSVIALSALMSQSGFTWRLGEREHAYISYLSGDTGAQPAYGGEACSTTRCEFNPTASETLYVIGDSHALALVGGVLRKYPDRRVVVFTHPGCKFFSKTYTIVGENGVDPVIGCDQARLAAFDEIAANPAPAILGQYWYQVPMRHSATGTVLVRDPEEHFGDFMLREALALRDNLAIPKLYLVGNVPTAGVTGASPLDCLGKIIPQRGCDAVPRDDPNLTVHSNFNALLSKGQEHDLGWVDPYDALCNDTHCWNTLEMRPVYIDQDHLSIWGSQLVAELYKF